MSELNEKVKALYGHKLRVRVCGVCIEQDKILLVHHRGLGKEDSLWAPPGGGMHYGEDAKIALQREFLEETGLSVSVERFLFVHEYLDPPLHGIELFFEVKLTGGQLKRGYDPEMSQEDQLITATGFKDLKEIKSKAPHTLHYVLQQINSTNSILNQSGYFKFH
ncbi:MAG: NUDIX hydrolase [Roseivirga sp.]|nr:NUDIX hydrolase [Roseivirga sp.]